MSRSFLPAWIAGLGNKRVIVLSNRDVTTKPFLFGEDYYIHTIASEAKMQGIPVEIQVLQVNGLKIDSREPLKNLERTVDKQTVLILHNVSPFHVVKLKIRKNVVIVMPVYFIWNKVSTTFTNLKESLGLLVWQLIVDEYLVPTPNLAQRLRKMGVFRRISIVPPEYACANCKRTDNLKKRLAFETSLPKTIDMVYIGSMIPKRFPLVEISDCLNRHKEREYHLRIYTMSKVKEREYTVGNVQVKITRTKLSDEEKCRILQRADVVIAPAEGTTMEPPLSVIEAEYHGNVIARFPYSRSRHMKNSQIFDPLDEK